MRKIKVLHNVMIHDYKINHDEQMLNPTGKILELGFGKKGDQDRYHV